MNMADDDKKKGLFGKAVDAISGRDEKEAISNLEAELEETKKEADAAKEAIKSLLKKDKTDSDKEVKDAEKKIAELESKLKDLERDKEIEARKADLQERMAEIEAQRKPEIITKHTVDKRDPTLSHIALKYYKHATPPYWKYLLEHNMEVLDGSEKNVRVGMVLDIPELPEELKD